MSLGNASFQTLTAPSSPVGPLGAVPTWCPAINPNPEWLHLDGVPGMEHLVEAAAARFGPAMGGLQGTPPGSPRPDTGPAPRQETWSVAYGNPPPWLPVGIPDDELYAAPRLVRTKAIRISTDHDPKTDRPDFMEPVTNGSSAVASPVDRGGGLHNLSVGIPDDELYRRPPPIRPTDEEVARMFPRGLPSILTDPITQEELDGSATPPGMPSFPAPRIGPKSEDHAE